MKKQACLPLLVLQGWDSATADSRGQAINNDTPEQLATFYLDPDSDLTGSLSLSLSLCASVSWVIQRQTKETNEYLSHFLNKDIVKLIGLSGGWIFSSVT